MKLIVGLGNPGHEYKNTRHNMGFMIIDNFLNEPNYQEKFNAQYFTKTIYGNKVIFVKPQTFMNLSGESVVKFVNYFKISLEDILVIHDDLDLEVGTYRLKKSSGDGGHNGIKSIINNLKSNDFCRLKIGIQMNIDIPTMDYVLGKLSLKETNALQINTETYNAIIKSFIRSGIEKTMCLYNGKER